MNRAMENGNEERASSVEPLTGMYDPSVLLRSAHAAWMDTPNSRETMLTNGLRVKRVPSVSVSMVAGINPGHGLTNIGGCR